MVSKIDSPKPLPGRPAAKARPPAKPAEPAVCGRDGLVLSKGAAGPAEGQPPVGQAWKVEGGKIHASTTMKLDAEPERVMAMIEGDWSAWWPRSAVERAPSEGGLPEPVAHEKRFRFREAAGAKATAYLVRQFEPKAEPAGGGALMMVVPVTLAGPVAGDARFEIREARDGKTLLTSRWDGVTPAGGAQAPEPAALAKGHLDREQAAFANLEAVIKRNP
jgi:hypothetical protein